MNSYMSGAQLKQMAKGQLYGRIGTVIGAFLVHMALWLVLDYSKDFVNASTTLGKVIYFALVFAIDMFLSIISTGECYLYLNVCTGNEATVSDVFYGFKGFAAKTLGVRFIPVLINTLVRIPVTIIATMFLSVSPSTEEMLDMMQNGRMNEAVEIAEKMMPFTSLFCGVGIFALLIIIAVDIVFSQSLFFMLDYPDYSVTDTLKNSIKILKGNWGRYLYIKLSFIPWYVLGLCTCYISFLWSFPYQKATMANFYMELIKNYNKDGNTADGYNY